MTNWMEVDRVRTENPDMTISEVARALGCVPQYVSATAKRRGWTFPKHNSPVYIKLRVLRELVEPLARPNETTHECLQRLVHKAIAHARPTA